MASHDTVRTQANASRCWKIGQMVAATVGLAIPRMAVALNYTFTNIADTTGPFSAFPAGLYGGPRLNNNGAVSFIAQLDAGGAGVYRSDGVAITAIADTSGPYVNATNSRFFNADINDAGQVAFLAESTALGLGIFRSDGVTTNTIVLQRELPFDSQRLLDEGEPVAISNAGVVAFFAHGDSGNPVDGIFVGSGGNIALISNAPAHRAFAPAVNNLGQVAYTYSPISSSEQGIRIGNGATTSLVINNSGSFSVFGRPDLNDTNVVGVAASLDAGGASVVRINGATVNVMAGTFTSVSDVGINNAGSMSFMAQVSTNVYSILTGPNTVTDKVIRDGDALFGSTATLFQGLTTIDGPNEAGQIVFRYLLGNGRQGIALATPVIPGVTGSIWKSDASGDWHANANWLSLAVPNGAGAEARLSNAITGARTIFANSPVSLGILRFDNVNSYLLAGHGSLTMQIAPGTSGSALVEVQQGSHKINVPLVIASNTNLTVPTGATLRISDPVTVNAGKTLVQSGGGTVLYESTVSLLSGASISFGNSSHLAALSLAAGANASILPGGGSLLTIDNLSLSSSAKLDVNNNGLLINYTGASPLASVQSQLAGGFTGGAWTGNGITSTSAASVAGTALGLAEATDLFTIFPAQFQGQTIDSSTLLILYTRYGDANLDRTVNTLDFNRLATAFNQSGQIWSDGDFNYDGLVNALDFNALATNFGNTLAIPALGAVVPEPTSITTLATMAALFGRRRKVSQANRYPFIGCLSGIGKRASP